jgi:hypothetical protein
MSRRFRADEPTLPAQAVYHLFYYFVPIVLPHETLALGRFEPGAKELIMDILDDWWLADSANKTSRHFAETPQKYHKKHVQDYFDAAEVVIGILPVRPGRKLDKVILKGRKLLDAARRNGKSLRLPVAVFSVRSIEEAAAMSHVFGDTPLP